MIAVDRVVVRGAELVRPDDRLAVEQQGRMPLAQLHRVFDPAVQRAQAVPRHAGPAHEEVAPPVVCASPERRARACRRLEDWDVMTPYGRSILGVVSANGYDLRPDASSLKIGTPRSAPAGGLDAWPVRAPVPAHRVQN